MYMRNVLIIGGNCDIGRSLSDYFLNKRYRVFIGYHNDNNEYIKTAKYIKCDVTNIDSIDNMIKNLLDVYGNIDIMINLACVCMDNSFLNKTKEEFMSELEINLVGTFLCNQIYSKYIDDGMIINMSSTDGVDTYNEYNMGYAVSKAGIITMSKSIAMSCGNKILCVCPNWINTSSTLDMDKDYLENELRRINQSRLIELDEFILGIDKIINGEFNSGDVFKIDIKDDRLWVEKI